MMNGISFDKSSILGMNKKLDEEHELLSTYVRPNLLDNWYFVGGGSQQGGEQFPINQRGQTSYAVNSYTIDRWKMANLTNFGTVAVNSDGIKITHSEDGGYAEIWQIIEDVQKINGKQVTVSAMVDGVVYSNTYTVGTTGMVSFGNIEFHRHNPGTNANDYLFLLRASDTTGATIQAVKLELGPTQTLAHQENGKWVLNEIPNYTEQLLRCSRGEQIDEADKGTTFPLYRQEAFVSSDTVPAINGAINWTYV